MATTENIARAQALYVAYYGRPADQEGLDYWSDRLEAEGESAIINAFGNSEEYTALAEGQGNATLVNNIYEQAFGRGADPEGLAYYTGVLASGEKTLAEIALTITNAAGGIDMQTFNARVEAAAAYTAEFGAAGAYDLEAAKAAVEAAKAGVDAAGLTEALETYRAAVSAESDFLKAQVDNDLLEADSLDKDSTLTEIRTAIDNAYAATADGVETATTEIGTDLTAAGTGSVDAVVALETRSLAVQDGIIADAVEQAEKNVTATEKLAEDGVLGAMSSVASAKNTLETAYETEVAAEKAYKGEAAKLASVNGVTVTLATVATTDPTTPIADTIAADDTITISGDDLAADIVLTLGANGRWSVPTGADVDSLEGFDALLADANAWGAATNQVTSSATTLQNAVDRAEQLQQEDDTVENAGTIGAVAFDADGEATVNVSFDTVELNNILAAREDLTDLNAAVEDFQAARALNTEADDLNDAVTEATEALTNDEDEGGLGITLVATGDNFVAGDELYVFDPEAADDADLSGFGASGQDRIFFGEEYSLVELSDEEAGEFLATTPDFSSDVGSASALEIFWAQSGSTVELFVETKAFAGNGTSNGDFVQISLTGGINADEFDFSGGYLTNGEVA
jgi:hypothetical protein